MTDKLKVVELGDVIEALADITAFKADTTIIPKPAAIFLCALGFEERCLAIASALRSANYKFDRAIYFEYNTNREDNEANRPALVEVLSAIAEDTQPLEAYGTEFNRYIRQLLEAAVAQSDGGSAPVVVFDVSVASNRLIMRCIKALLEFKVRLIVLYAEAAVYYPTRDEYDQDPERWCRDETIGLEKGVGYVHTSEQYPGYHIDQLPDCVVVFPSFRPERSRAVMSSIDPSLLVPGGDNVLWMIGKPRLPEDSWRMDAMRAINELTAASVQYDVSTFDYKETLRVLEMIYLERAECARFTLSPTGSKMQAVGSALTCYLHPDIRVIFSSPEKFNASHYSTGCKATYCVDFGSLADLRTKLDRIGQIELVH